MITNALGGRGGLPPTGSNGAGYYDGDVAVYNKNSANLARTRAARARALSGQGLWRIGLAGDSIFTPTYGQPKTQAPAFILRQLLAQKYGASIIGGTGFMPVWNNALSSIYNDSRWTWSVYPSVGAASHWDALGFQAWQVWSVTNADTVTVATDVAITNGNVTFWYWDFPTSTFTYNINAAGPNTITTAGTFALKKVVVTGVTLTVGQSTVFTNTTVSATNACPLAGVSYDNPTGISVSNMGVGGAQLYIASGNSWTNSNSTFGLPFLQAAQAPVFDTIVQDCVINDIVNLTVPNFVTQAGVFQSGLNALGTDLAWAIPVEPALPADGQTLSMTAANWLAGYQAVYASCDKYNLAAVDLTDRLGHGASATSPWANANTNGIMQSQTAATGTVSGTGVTGWQGTPSPQPNDVVSGGGFPANTIITGGISGYPGNWNFTASAAGTSGAASLTVGSNDGIHMNPGGYAGVGDAILELIT